MAGKDEDILKDAQEAFGEAQEAEADNRAKAIHDVRFARLDDQWPTEVKRDRDLDGLPSMTENQLPAFIRQVVNDARQNKISINVRPVDDSGDPETAEILNGLIRNIEQVSRADAAYDTALEHAVDRGLGYFAIDLEYAHDETFDQDIVINQIANPFSVYGDPNSSAIDSADWNTTFVLDRLPKRDFKDRYGDAEACDFSADALSSTGSPLDTGDQVTLASWWRRTQVRRKILALSDGQIVAEDVYKAQKAMFDALGVTVIGQPRPVPSWKVTQYVLSGSEVLETVDWAGKYIPIIPVYGEVVNLEGTRHLRSLIRPAKDAQVRYNHAISTMAEKMAEQPLAPWIGKVGTFKTDRKRWATANRVRHPYLEFDGEAPQRQPPTAFPAAEAQAALQAKEDMKSIMGLHDASLGIRSNETSGKAIMARQREGDISTFHFADNLARAVSHAGRILVDLIPKVYAAPRVLRIIGPDEKPRLVPVNQKFQAPAQQQPGAGPAGLPEQGEGQQVEQVSKIYDLTVGRYDVTVSPGPSFTSRREEAATQMIQLIQSYPAAAPVIGDLLAKNLDWPGADEVAERLRALLPPELRGGQDPAAMKAQADMQKMTALIQQLQEQVKNLEADHSIDQQKVQVDMYNAQTNRLKVEQADQSQEIARLQAVIAQLTGGAMSVAT